MLGHSIVSQHFMEPVGSIPNSELSPRLHNMFKTQSNFIIIPSMPRYSAIYYTLISCSLDLRP
jgi:hypothetical protein